MLIKRIDDELKSALRQKDSARVSTLRLLKSAIHNLSIEKQSELKQEDIIAVIRKEAKQREDSIEKFKQGNRRDLADREERELEILKEYLPEDMDQEELIAIIRESIKESGAEGIKDTGRVMKLVMPKVKQRANGKTVSALVNRELKPKD